MRVTANNSETLAATRDAEDEFSELARRMLAAVNVGAAFEKAHKTYTDRTGNLKRNTRGRIDQNRRDTVVVDLEMAEDYASYVKKRGLSAFDDAVNRTNQAIADEMDSIGKRVTG